MISYYMYQDMTMANYNVIRHDNFMILSHYNISNLHSHSDLLLF